jgi:hypothetical protein
VDTAADQAITACSGNAREAVKALIVANSFLEEQIAELRTVVSTGYSRGKFAMPPLDRRIGRTDVRGDLLRCLPFILADDGIALAEPSECFNPNAAVMRAERRRAKLVTSAR